jgi:alpha 1,3-glucosidase
MWAFTVRIAFDHRHRNPGEAKLNDRSASVVLPLNFAQKMPRGRGHGKVFSTPMLALSFLCLALLLPAALMVKHEDFKRCDQSGFCTRQRAYADLAHLQGPHYNSEYAVVVGTVKSKDEEGLIEADLTNKRRNVWYALQLRVVEGGIIRIQIDEKNGLKPRHRTVGSIVNEKDLQPTPIQRHFLGKKECIFSFSDETEKVLHLQMDPFRVDVSVNGVAVLSLNHRGLFNFEELRRKPEVVASEAAETGTVSEESSSEPTEAAISESETESDLKTLQNRAEQSQWEETWKTHQDLKPNGKGPGDRRRIRQCQLLS